MNDGVGGGGGRGWLIHNRVWMGVHGMGIIS